MALDLRKNDKTAIQALAIVVVGALLLGWSVWYWTYHPESYTSTMTIHQRCEDDATSPYCFGYAAGYNWCVDQIELQKELDKINPYK